MKMIFEQRPRRARERDEENRTLSPMPLKLSLRYRMGHRLESGLGGIKTFYGEVTCEIHIYFVNRRQGNKFL